MHGAMDKLLPATGMLIQDVELHSLGRKEYGSLQLLKHHFVFRYYPGARRGVSSATSLQEGPTAPLKPSADTLSGGDASGKSINANKELRDANVKPRAVEMWIAYPLINHCILRPSHSPGQYGRSQGNEHLEASPANEDELFPPTIGTSDYGRASTDSARFTQFSSSPRPLSPSPYMTRDPGPGLANGRQPAIRLRLRDFRMMALHFHSAPALSTPDDTAREVFYALRKRTCVENLEDLHAFHFDLPKEERAAGRLDYDARREYARMGVSSKAAHGPGSAWRISDINTDYSFSATYPGVLCVPQTISDNIVKYGGPFRSRCRIPCLSYLHPNGGSITRSSQPMVGVQGKRNPQDERLVSAIFTTQTGPPRSLASSLQLPAKSPTSVELDRGQAAAQDQEKPQIPTSHSDTALNELPEEKLDVTRQKVYGSTRSNLIVDARPKINALANRAAGGGIEDVANYSSPGDMPVQKVFLNIANIHVMRASLERVVESFANSDYIKVKPDQDVLRKSGWLGHIAGLIDGTEMVVRAIGLGGSHVLVHCSDGWDRTAQVSALAQVMLDPHCRTMTGFIALVQKEFLSFGHKFRDRNGIEGVEKWFEIENERIAPARTREGNNSDPATINAVGARALHGARNWFEKTRGSIFRQQNDSQDNVAEKTPSRPPSPPINSLIHSPAGSGSRDEKKVSEKEVAPIFHQFLDAAYQLLYHHTDAFEFNERFLRRLFYHTYSCQYGEFLFNCERERVQLQARTGSVWSHFLSRKAQFTNPDFVPKVEDPLLFPKRSGGDSEVEVRWWHELFGRSNEEMNVPPALARPKTGLFDTASAASVSFDERTTVGRDPSMAVRNGSIKATQSTPNLVVPEVLSGEKPAATDSETNAGSAAQDTSGPSVAELNLGDQGPSVKVEGTTSSDTVAAAQVLQPEEAIEERHGDPLGVMASTERVPERARLDFAAFASNNAFRD